MHKSVATINSPEFINLQPLDINPLMSKCEIKVLYVGENRNRTFISKEVATEMAKTLRGAPIVGYYKEDKEDFADHGEVVTIDDEGFHFECKTKPYGFVAPDAKVWFQEFEDTNDFGETCKREYLMTVGYLWTGQYEECKSAVEGEGKPHSMELDRDTLQGHWDTNAKGMDFFIINDATFSKLCILGTDVEPCFEGSSVTAPNVSASFTKADDAFRQTLFTMMQELKTALEGGQQMNNEGQEPIVENAAAPVEPEAQPEEPVGDPAPVNSFAASEGEGEGAVQNEEGVAAEEPAADTASEADPEPAAAEDPAPAEPAPAAEDYEVKYTAINEELISLQAKYSELESKYAELESANAKLVEFKRQIDDAKKDEMINKFYMLSDDDKKDVIENKANYTVEEIESKLSVICVRKKVNFNLEDTAKNDNKVETSPITTFNLTDDGASSTPAWIQAVKNTQSSRN